MTIPKVIDIQFSLDPKRVEGELRQYRGYLITFLGTVKKHVSGWGKTEFYRFMIQDPVQS